MLRFFCFFYSFFYFFLFFYFLNFISKAHKLYFRNRLNESFSGNVNIFSIFFYFLRKNSKMDKFFKVSTVSILCSYTSIFAKFSANVPSSKVHQMSTFGASNPYHLLMAASQSKDSAFFFQTFHIFLLSNISYLRLSFNYEAIFTKFLLIAKCN